MRTAVKTVSLLLGPALFFFFLFVWAPEGMSYLSRAALATTAWMAVWWITEAVPMAVTSLMPIILLPMTGAMGIAEVTAPYADKMIFLFLGGFLIAIAMERWNLHRRIAMTIILGVGSNMRRVILGFMLATAFLSMWISNTATTMMLMPIGLAVITQIAGMLTTNAEQVEVKEQFGKALMLGIAYAASIGGLATLVGTPTNPIFVSVVEDLYGKEISFSSWFLFSIPGTATFLVISWWYLTHIGFRMPKANMEGARAVIARELHSLGPIKAEEVWVMAIFGLVALLWILRPVLLSPYLPVINDPMIAIGGAVLLFIIPSKSQKGVRLMDWESTQRLPWGILLLFGGGLSIAAAFRSTGLAQYIGDSMAGLNGLPFWLILLLVTLLVNFLTEITSNVATATMILPVLAVLSVNLGVHPYPLMVGATLASSCAFMLPVATAPNAVVFGSGMLHVKDMARAGFMLNLISVIIITMAVYIILPLLWGFDMTAMPEGW